MFSKHTKFWYTEIGILCVVFFGLLKYAFVFKLGLYNYTRKLT